MIGDFFIFLEFAFVSFLIYDSYKFKNTKNTIKENDFDCDDWDPILESTFDL